MTPPTTPSQRLYFLDWLRVLAFVTLVIYHVGMYYVSWDFHVKSPDAGHGLEPWMKLTEPWRMSLIFMISGAATALLFRQGATAARLKQRTRYLLLPLLCGIVLIVPPQSYFEVVQKFGFAGSYFDFLRLYFGRFHGFCQDGHCLVLPTWNHLWFLPYVWLYTCGVALVLMRWPRALTGATPLTQRLSHGVGLWLWPIAYLLLARWALLARFPVTHDVVHDVYSHAMYGGMFLLGALFGVAASPWDHMARQRWGSLALALVMWAILVFVRPAKPLEHAVVAIYQWAALMAAFGFAKALLNHDSPHRAMWVEAVFPVYLFHQTILIVLTQWLLPWHLRPAFEGPLLIVLTLSLSFLGYWLAKQTGPLRPLFGLKPA